MSKFGATEPVKPVFQVDPVKRIDPLEVLLIHTCNKTIHFYSFPELLKKVGTSSFQGKV